MAATESERSRYFEQLLLKRAGILVSEEQISGREEEYQPVIHRTATLSQIRHEAERLSRKKRDNPTADISELTEAERLFQEHLGDKVND